MCYNRGMKHLLITIFCVVLTACGGGGGGSASPPSPTRPQTSITLSVSNTVYNNAVGDLNGDGLEDVVVSGWNYDSTTAYVWVLIQNADGTLSDKTATLLPTNVITGSQHVFVADFDNDGKNDIFIPGFLDGSIMGSTTSTMFWNNGTSFSRQVFNEQLMAHGACLDDINGDGKVDILAAGNFGASVLYINNGNRSFTADTTTLSNNWFATCAVTHQSNGDVNILMGNNSNLAGYNSVVAVYNSVLQFQNYVGVSTGAINSAAFDANGDGVKDFVLAADGNAVRRVVLNTGLNSYVDGQQLDTFGSDYFTLVTTVNGAPAVFLPESSVNSRLYYVSHGAMVAYKATSFPSMANGQRVLNTSVYRGNGKMFMMQLFNDGQKSFFMTQEM